MSLKTKFLVAASALFLLAPVEAEIVRQFPEKSISGRTFTAQIPTHWDARQIEIKNEKVDNVLITDDHALPVDKYFRPGQFPGRVRISIRLLPVTAGKQVPPKGAKDWGKELALGGAIRAREWILPSSSPHELGLFRTIRVGVGDRTYELVDSIPTVKYDMDERRYYDYRIVGSMKPLIKGEPAVPNHSLDRPAAR